MKPILPGATIGILGGGQLGRMAAMAARALGYRVHVLDPDPNCACAPVVDKLITAPFEDPDGAVELAKGCDVVTLEIEKVSVEGLRRAAQVTPVRPSAEVLHVIQDKGRQKSWLKLAGFPVGPFALAQTGEEIVQACARFHNQAFVKRFEGGYDGRGQVTVRSEQDAKEAFGALGNAPCIVEQALELEAEISVLVARRPSGETAAYPPALNHHEHRILDISQLPAPISRELADEAVALCRKVTDALKVEGLLVVELFLLPGGKLVVNEMAPRPHNTFHATEVSCVTSQFEQLIRAVCDLPLGTCTPMRPAAIVNLLGDIWLGRDTVPFDRVLEIPCTRLHLYGKGPARPGRKMGHLTAVGDTPEEALQRVREAKRRLQER
ncbi:MAG: 5-(carboxyamino)imidazole ribonucleotide synthase [Myxococcaceae bacterium]